MRVLFTLVLCIQVYLVLSNCTFNRCPTDETCCQGPNPGDEGCCPSPNAVCCSDGLHCCAENTKREQPEIKLQATTETERQQKALRGNCPEGSAYCPPGTSTCCRHYSGQYTCCQLISAVCCRDKVHCCPYGTTCTPNSQNCVPGGTLMAGAAKRLRRASFLLPQ